LGDELKEAHERSTTSAFTAADPSSRGTRILCVPNSAVSLDGDRTPHLLAKGRKLSWHHNLKREEVRPARRAAVLA